MCFYCYTVFLFLYQVLLRSPTKIKKINLSKHRRKLESPKFVYVKKTAYYNIFTARRVIKCFLSYVVLSWYSTNRLCSNQGWTPGRVFYGFCDPTRNPGSRPSLFLAPGSRYPNQNPEFFGFLGFASKNSSQPVKSEMLTKFSLNETIWQLK